MTCEKYFYDLIVKILKKWNLDDIGAISMVVYANESYTYKEYRNFYEVTIGYVTKRKINDANMRWDELDEQDMTFVFEPFCYGEESEILLNWMKEKGIKDIGEEDYENDYDEDMNYIGKGPNGYYEVLMMLSDVIKNIKLGEELGGAFSEIPVIIHDLEFAWYTEDATLHANPNNEAKGFIEYFRRELK